MDELLDNLVREHFDTSLWIEFEEQQLFTHPLDCIPDVFYIDDHHTIARMSKAIKDKKEDRAIMNKCCVCMKITKLETYSECGHTDMCYNCRVIWSKHNGSRCPRCRTRSIQHLTT